MASCLSMSLNGHYDKLINWNGEDVPVTWQRSEVDDVGVEDADIAVPLYEQVMELAARGEVST